MGRVSARLLHGGAVSMFSENFISLLESSYVTLNASYTGPTIVQLYQMKISHQKSMKTTRNHIQ